jgi:uncharacterized protein YhaN
MKISKISLFKYGKFIDKISFKFSENRPNVVYGKNEAGKSTITSAIGELIFGFTKTRKDRHPYLPWTDELIRVEMNYLNRENRVFTINRLLSNNAKATLIDGLAQNPMGNVALPEADFITHNIYQNVYMITSEQLQEIENKTLGQLQDKLLLNYGNSNVSPKTVVSRLNEDLKEIYNSRSRNNKQVMNGLMSQIKELKHERKDKMDLYSQVRVMRDDIEKLESELKELDLSIKEKVKLKHQINRYLNPIQLVTKLDNLKSNIENYDRYGALEKDILDNYEVLKKDFLTVKKQLEEKELRINDRREKIEILSKDERLALGIRNNVESIEELEESFRKASTELEKTDERLQVNEKKLKNEVEYLFEEDIKSVGSFDIQEIQSLYFKSKEDVGEKTIEPLSVIKLVAIIALLAAGIFTKNTYGIIVLVITLLVVVFDLIDRRSKGKNKSAELLKERLKEIGVKAILVENFTEINLRNLENMIEIKEKTIDYLAGKDLASEKILTLKAEQQGIFEDFDEVHSLRQLREVLGQAITKESLNQEIKNNLEIDNADFLSIDQERLAIENQLGIITRKIRKIGDGDFEKGYQLIETYLPAQARIEHYEAELSESFNIATLREELDQVNTEIINEDYFSIIENEIEELKQRHEDTGKYCVQLKSEISHKIHGDTLDVIEGKIALREEMIQEHSHHYDLLAVLNEAVKRGDERFREKNQPDVLRLASKYFAAMTVGRYTDVLIEDNDQIFIKSKHGELISADEELSAGTKNQLYLSLRLAFISYLDRDREKLPIMLDEVFSNWDSERLEPTLGLINQIAKERQVILFTCKEDNLRHYENHLSQIQKIIIS